MTIGVLNPNPFAPLEEQFIPPTYAYEIQDDNGEWVRIDGFQAAAYRAAGFVVRKVEV